MDYDLLCRLCELLEQTTKRLEKTKILSDFLEVLSEEELERVLLLVQGLVYPIWHEGKLGFSSSYVIKALARAVGVSTDTIGDVWRDTGDLGLCAQQLVEEKKQVALFQQTLTIQKVFSNLRKLTTMSGEGSVDTKVGLVAELLSHATAREARFIVRVVLDELRIGLGSGTIRDALIWAFCPKLIGITVDEERVEGATFDINIDAGDPIDWDVIVKQSFISGNNFVLRVVYNEFSRRVQHALDMSNDFGLVAQMLRNEGVTGLKKVSLSLGNPINVMLALKEETIENAFKRVGKPAALEYKLDGFRVQVHKRNSGILLFTRRLENVTAQFPDVIAAVHAHVFGECILDCEVVGVDPVSHDFLPFQKISQRIKRKHDIVQMAKELPVHVFVFDILYANGRNLIDVPFQERRGVMESVVTSGRSIQIIEQKWTDDEKEAQEFYQHSLSVGNEGIMFKNVTAVYQPGSRTGGMVKMKPIMETLDLVIVEAEWGEGRRADWLSSYVVACRDGDELRVVGRVSTGLKEKKEEGLSFSDVTDLLKPTIVKQKGKNVIVVPGVVLEVAFEEVQVSQHYDSGFALRFPRIVRLREDRNAGNCSTLDDVKRLFNG
jgi:DNA ligase 1